MNVAVIVKSLQIGGMERAAINLSELFSSQGHQTHLIYLQDKNQVLTPNKTVHLHLIDLEIIFKKKYFSGYLKVLFKILNSILRQSYFWWKGIIYTNIFNTKFQDIESVHGKFDIVIIRGHSTIEMIWKFKHQNLIVQQVNILPEMKKSFLKHFYRRSIFSNKHVVCNSKTILKELRSGFLTSKVVAKSLNVIASPVNNNLILKKATEYNISFERKYIINVGRLTPTKNIELLINAFSYAHKNLGLKHSLVIVGEGKSKEILQKQSKELHLDEYIFFTGSLENPYPWLKNADLFVFTSKNEGLPNVLLESLVCQTNIVATKGRGGTLDIMSGELKENLTSFNIKELAEKIVETLKNKQDINFERHLQPYASKTIIQSYLEYTTSKYL